MDELNKDVEQPTTAVPPAADGEHHEHHEPMPEGEEAAPPGTHTMAIVRWALVALMAIAAAGSLLYFFGAFEGSGLSQAAELYQCPMHPSVMSDHPGECPICGMSLVKVERGAKPGAAAAAQPPAPEQGHEGHRHDPSDPYYCSMCPEETSPTPDARCPKCGMKMVPRAQPPAGAAPAPGGHAGHGGAPAGAPAGSGVAGLVPIELSPERIQLMGMKTARAVREKLVPELRTVGTLAATEQGVAHVHTRFSGWIEELFVNQTGEPVKKGQVLATVYSPELFAAQQEYVNALKWAGEGGAPVTEGLARDARRKLELLGISDPEIEELQKTGKPSRALKIRSPVQGYVIEKQALQGLYVQPGTELFQLADLTEVWLLADIYEYEVGRVKIGQNARLTLAAYPGRTFTGKVQFIYPALNSESRTLRVRISFRNPALELKPGMYGDVAIDLAGAEGLLVPRDAVVDTGEEQYVFLALGEGRFEPRRVRLGARSGAKVEIAEGLAEGDTVVTTANFLLDSESRLRAAIEGMGK